MNPQALIVKPVNLHDQPQVKKDTCRMQNCLIPRNVCLSANQTSVIKKDIAMTHLGQDTSHNHQTKTDASESSVL